jgi:hypothetical protein
MPSKPQVFRPSGQRSKVERNREADARRGSAASRGYDGKWVKASKAHQRAHPLCAYCEAGAWGDPPRVTASALTDHLYPHGGDKVLFWLSRLWVSCCADCHNGPKQAAERRGRSALDALARRLGRPLLSEVL